MNNFESLVRVHTHTHTSSKLKEEKRVEIIYSKNIGNKIGLY